jgi:hypothetical protein
MDRLRSQLLARTRVVVLDPDHADEAATRPIRDVDVDRIERELAGLGYVPSLDLAHTLRRIPGPSVRELGKWVVATLAQAPRPIVEIQACPWCTRVRDVAALAPCGHLACRTCWKSSAMATCPLCFRRVPPHAPLVAVSEPPRALLHLAFDVAAVSRVRLGELALAATPDRDALDELDVIVDAFGPDTAAWLPARIPHPAVRARLVARLLVVARDRIAMMMTLAPRHAATPACVLGVARVLLGTTASRRARARSIARDLRRALLAALDALAPDDLAAAVRRERSRWQRLGEQLHPGEHADRFPNAARAFALARNKRVPLPDPGTRPRPRPRRLDTLVGLQRADDALADADHVLRTGRGTTDELGEHVTRASARRLLALLAHLRERAIPASRLLGNPGSATPGAEPDQGFQQPAKSEMPSRLLVQQPASDRVFAPRGELALAYRWRDTRPPLAADLAARLDDMITGELVARAEAARHVPRAVIARALDKVVVPRTGSQLALANRERLAFQLDGAASELVAVLFDEVWRVTGEIPVARELALVELPARGARHAVIVARVIGDGIAQLALAGTPARFALRAPAAFHVLCAITLADNASLQLLDVRVASRARVARAGGFHALLAHVARDATTLARVRPTRWDIAAIHACARSHVVYVRERDASCTMFRRRDREPSHALLARLRADDHDGRLAIAPLADAPTYFALLERDPELADGSLGFTLADDTAALLAELAPLA